MSTFLKNLRERAAALPRRIAFCEIDDDRTTAALRTLTAERLVQPIAVGDAGKVEARLRSSGILPGAVEIIDPAADLLLDDYADTFYTLRKARGVSYDAARATLHDPLFYAAMLVRDGRADGSVAGAVRTTADVLRAAIFCVGPAPDIKSVSSAFYMVVPPFRSDAHEVLTFTDASVIPDPDAQQLADIADGAASAREKIVGDEPRVAFLSFSTYGSAQSASTEKVRAALALFRERRPDVVADGELQADAALIEQIGVRKAPGSAVAGRANVLVFPNLDAGNIAYKLVQRLAHAEAIGPVMQGLAKPCNDLSRGASAGDIVNVACITALQAAVSTEQKLPPAGATV
jgi:phosphate acetyltransferase